MRYKVFTLIEPGSTKIQQIEKKYPRINKIIEPLAIWLDRFIEQKLGIVLDRFETFAHPQEDYFLVSNKYPIFVVADEVTLPRKITHNYYEFNVSKNQTKRRGGLGFRFGRPWLQFTSRGVASRIAPPLASTNRSP